MELGALVRTPRRPRCGLCPVAKGVWPGARDGLGVAADAPGALRPRRVASLLSSFGNGAASWSAKGPPGWSTRTCGSSPTSSRPRE